jgi:hypothetical protein
MIPSQQSNKSFLIMHKITGIKHSLIILIVMVLIMPIIAISAGNYRLKSGSEPFTATYQLVNDNGVSLKNCYLGTHLNDYVDGKHGTYTPRNPVVISNDTPRIGVGFTDGVVVRSRSAGVTNYDDLVGRIMGGKLIDQTYYTTDDNGRITVTIDRDTILDSVGYDLTIRAECKNGIAEGHVLLGLTGLGIVNRHNGFIVRMRTILGDPTPSNTHEWIESDHHPSDIGSKDEYKYSYSNIIE